MQAIKIIDNEKTLKSVLEMCWDILGKPKTDTYSEQAWKERLTQSELLIYMEVDGEIVSAALGRAESPESVVLGYCCCKKEFRRSGITSSLLGVLEKNASKSGYKYITLGSDDSARGFYEKCGYTLVNEIHGQRVYQKIL